jgi:hypothetical protein
MYKDTNVNGGTELNVKSYCTWLKDTIRKRGYTVLDRVDN